METAAWLHARTPQKGPDIDVDLQPEGYDEDCAVSIKI